MCLLDFRLEAAHPSEASEDGLPHRAAEAEGTFGRGIGEVIEAFPILVTSRIMFEQSAQRGDPKFRQSGELRTSDPSQFLKQD